MHETRIAIDLVAMVTEIANRHGLKRVDKVNLQFGEMIQIVPDIFRFAFREAVRGTASEEAEVDLEILPVRLVCNQCHKECPAERMVFRCIHCQSGDLDIIQGKEMIIKSLEGE